MVPEDWDQREFNKNFQVHACRRGVKKVEKIKNRERKVRCWCPKFSCISIEHNGFFLKKNIRISTFSIVLIEYFHQF
jgi:hypothetical protein